MATTSLRLAQLWKRCEALPAGRWLFRHLLGWFIPYTGSIGATVLELGPGHCRAELPDRRRVRNHLDSIHAVALINLGEMASGLAMTMALPGEVRGIVTELGAEYFKKARGTLTAVADVTVPTVGDTPIEHRVEAKISDAAGELVCRVHATWRLARR
jgi:acyl-coenzyme A thioesterase PaaI-like protein